MDELSAEVSKADKIIEDIDYLEKRVTVDGDLVKSYRRGLRNVVAAFKHMLEAQTSAIDGGHFDGQSLLEIEQDRRARNELLKGLFAILETQLSQASDLLRNPTLYLDSAHSDDRDRAGKELERILGDGTKEFDVWVPQLRSISRRFDEVLAFRSREYSIIEPMLNTMPFGMDVGNAEEDIERICSLNNTETSTALVTSCAIGLGSRRTDSSKSSSIQKLCEVQIKLLESLPLKKKRHLTPESTHADTLQCASMFQGSATQSEKALLKNLKGVINSALKRERHPTISIALCGTVKAG
ncbi:hypothetical protein SCHPADRAFT_279730 [Schizopora paradoxa]|uniref:Uncharacterized protein n=1 Tax=Schizopora paradoxa TaxID=27342 RepID=A0A0H2S028_9AGAM|nr:hypothetical protein SCHPADRAFT_279730 [Schizopora paradoxa]